MTDVQVSKSGNYLPLTANFKCGAGFVQSTAEAERSCLSFGLTLSGPKHCSGPGIFLQKPACVNTCKYMFLLKEILTGQVLIRVKNRLRPWIGQSHRNSYFC